MHGIADSSTFSQSVRITVRRGKELGEGPVNAYIQKQVHNHGVQTTIDNRRTCPGLCDCPNPGRGAGYQAQGHEPLVFMPANIYL